MPSNKHEFILETVDKTQKGFTSAQSGLKRVQSEADRTKKSFDKLQTSTKQADKSMGVLGRSLIGFVAGGALLRLGKGIMNVNIQLEQNEVAFTTMLGSAEKAKSFLEELSDFAVRTPFQIPDVRQNAKLLMAMGIEVENVLPTMKALGDISAGLNVPMSRLALNFGQVKTQGKLTGRELRDFSVAGVPLVAELAKQLGVSKNAIADMVSAGEIGFDKVEEAFKSMTGEGGKFNNLMEEQSKTLGGIFSNIADSFTRRMEAFRDTSSFEVLKDMAKGFQEASEQGAGFSQTIEGIAKVLLSFALMLGAGVNVLNKFTKAISGFVAEPMIQRKMINEERDLLMKEKGKTYKELYDQQRAAGENVLVAGLIASKQQAEQEKRLQFEANLKTKSKRDAFQRLTEGDAEQHLLNLEMDLEKSQERMTKLWSKGIKERAKIQSTSVTGGGGGSTEMPEIEIDEKTIKAIDTLQEKYVDLEEKVGVSLDKFELKHAETVDKIKGKIDDLKEKLEDLKEGYEESIGGLDTSIGERVIEQEKKIEDAKKAMTEASKANDHAAYEEARILLKKENEALQEFMKDSKGFEDEISEARRRSKITDFERFIEDAEKKRTELVKQYEEKKAQLEESLADEQKALEQEQVIYEEKREMYHKIQEKFKVMADSIISGNANLVDDATKTVEALKKQYEELEKQITRIKNLTAPTGMADTRTLDQVFSSTGIDAPFRAQGGFVQSNEPYIVGERGPELFVPKQNGDIVPNRSAGGGINNLSVNVNVGSVDSRESANTLADRIAEIVLGKAARLIKIQQIA